MGCWTGRTMVRDLVVPHGGQQENRIIKEKAELAAENRILIFITY